jgi:hypothetical protein
MRYAAVRTRKLARDMLIFWKRIDKEQVFFYIPETCLLKIIFIEADSECAVV